MKQKHESDPEAALQREKTETYHFFCISLFLFPSPAVCTVMQSAVEYWKVVGFFFLKHLTCYTKWPNGSNIGYCVLRSPHLQCRVEYTCTRLGTSVSFLSLSVSVTSWLKTAGRGLSHPLASFCQLPHTKGHRQSRKVTSRCWMTFALCWQGKHYEAWATSLSTVRQNRWESLCGRNAEPPELKPPRPLWRCLFHPLCILTTSIRITQSSLLYEWTTFLYFFHWLSTFSSGLDCSRRLCDAPCRWKQNVQRRAALRVEPRWTKLHSSYKTLGIADRAQSFALPSALPRIPPHLTKTLPGRPGWNGRHLQGRPAFKWVRNIIQKRRCPWRSAGPGTPLKLVVEPRWISVQYCVNLNK